MNLVYGWFGIICVSSLLGSYLFWRVVAVSVKRGGDSHLVNWFNRLTPIFVLWVIAGSVLALSPLFRTPWEFTLRPVFILLPSIFAPVFITMLLFRVAVHRQLLETVQLHQIFLVHTVRAVIGSGFLGLYALGYLPVGFALEAGLGDIAIGLSAIPVALLLQRKAKYALTIAILWNILGVVDLLNALRRGVGELAPFIVNTQTPLLIGMVPLMAVPLAIIWHFYSLRLLRQKILLQGSQQATPLGA
jgi:hypothetical protein